MAVINAIASFFMSLSNFAYEGYLVAYDWVAPFNYLANPFLAISDYFRYVGVQLYEFGNWCDNVWNIVQQAITEFNIWDVLAVPIEWAQTAWEWVSNAFTNVWNTITDWWGTVQEVVMTWVDNVREFAQSLYNNLQAWLANLQEAWNNFVSKIPTIDEIINWFRNWWGQVLANIQSWWAERLLDIQNLINSTLITWFPFYDDLILIWESIREFFADPLQWVYDRLEEFFERFW